MTLKSRISQDEWRHYTNPENLPTAVPAHVADMFTNALVRASTYRQRHHVEGCKMFDAHCAVEIPWLNANPAKCCEIIEHEVGTVHSLLEEVKSLNERLSEMEFGVRWTEFRRIIELQKLRDDAVHLRQHIQQEGYTEFVGAVTRINDDTEALVATFNPPTAQRDLLVAQLARIALGPGRSRGSSSYGTRYRRKQYPLFSRTTAGLEDFDEQMFADITDELEDGASAAYIETCIMNKALAKEERRAHAHARYEGDVLVVEPTEELLRRSRRCAEATRQWLEALATLSHDVTTKGAHRIALNPYGSSFASKFDILGLFCGKEFVKPEWHMMTVTNHELSWLTSYEARFVELKGLEYLEVLALHTPQVNDLLDSEARRQFKRREEDLISK